MRKDRRLILIAKEYFNKRKITVLEVGVFNGGNAISMLKNLNIEKLYLVDPYEEYDDFKNSSAKWTYTQMEYDKLYKKTRKRLQKYGDKVKLIREKSSVVKINDTFDFVYLDGNYSEVRSDFDKFYPMLKTGGIIGGYAFKPVHRQLVEDVFSLVDDYGLEDCLGGDCNEWWIKR